MSGGHGLAGTLGVMQQTVQSFEPQVAAQPGSGGEVDLFAILRTLWLGKSVIALFAALALGYGLYKSVIAGIPLYTAQAEMALQLAAPSALDIEAVVAGFSGDQASINTEMAVITSGELIERLVTELRLDEDPEFNLHIVTDEDGPGPVATAIRAAKDAVKGAIRSLAPERAGGPGGAEEEVTPEDVRRDVVEAVREAFRTESNWDTYVFTIHATTQDPDKSALLANTLGRLYRDDQIRIKVEAAERMAIWLSERVGELRAELDTSQREIADLRASSSLVSDESMQALNLAAIELRTQLGDAEKQLAEIDERLTQLRAAQASGDLEAKLEAAQDGRLDSMAGDIADGEPGAQLRFDRRFEQVLLQSEAERRRSQDQVDELRNQAEELTAQFEGQSSDLLALQQLEQEAEATRVLYETFLTRLKEASAQSSVYEADTRLLTAAAPGLKVAPRTTAILLMSLVLGLLAGSGFVLLREFRQNSFRTAEDLERHTGRPVVGQIPLIPTRNRPDTIRYLVSKPTSAAAEAVRNLRTSILLSDIDNPPRLIMTTSSVPSEGKTTVSIALAMNLASLDKRVLLIEGDIRRRTFEAYFGDPKRSGGGLLSVVTGRQALAEAVVRPEGLGFDVLMGERSSLNAADLFSSESFRRLLAEARAAYDYVVIDTPPVLVVPDARVIAQHVDAVVYVVQWDSTSRPQVENGLKSFQSVNVPVSGLVLSKINPRGMRRYGYGGAYGAYARYGRAYYDA